MAPPMQRELQLIAFMTAFERWNTKINLASIKNTVELSIKHVQDSLSLLELFDFEAGQRVLDLGTGGGFPGLPLAIMLPEVEFVLMDATAKKMHAVAAIADEIGLKNVHTVIGRAETLAHDEAYREAFGMVVSRAVAPLPILLEYAVGFLCVHGLFVAYKSTHYHKEFDEAAAALNILNLSFEGPMNYVLPHGLGSRSLLVFRKEKPLSEYYPRKVGIPKKNPLSST